MDLCSWCQSFAIHRLVRSPNGRGTFPLKLALEGARSSCSFCALLVDAVLARAQRPFDDEAVRIYLQATTARASPGSVAADITARSGAALNITGLRIFLASAGYEVRGEKPVSGSYAALNVCADPSERLPQTLNSQQSRPLTPCRQLRGHQRCHRG